MTETVHCGHCGINFERFQTGRGQHFVNILRSGAYPNRKFCSNRCRQRAYRARLARSSSSAAPAGSTS
jgi:hypothetical protein